MVYLKKSAFKFNLDSFVETQHSCEIRSNYLSHLSVSRYYNNGYGKDNDIVVNDNDIVVNDTC